MYCGEDQASQSCLGAKSNGEGVIAGSGDEVEGEHDLLLRKPRQQLDIGFDFST